MAKRKYTTAEALDGKGGRSLQLTVGEFVRTCVGTKNADEQRAYQEFRSRERRAAQPATRATRHAAAAPDADERARLRAEILRRVR